MKFNIFFTLKGPARIMIGVPNKTNPVVSENLSNLLAYLSDNLPFNTSLGIEIIGVEIKPEIEE